MPSVLRFAVLLCGLNLAWAQPAPAPDPATRAAISGRGGAPGAATTDVRTVCAAGPGLQRQVIDASTVTALPVDCAQVLGGTQVSPVDLAENTEIAPFRVQTRSSAGTWRTLGNYGSQAVALEAANAACKATPAQGTARVRAARILQAGKEQSTGVDCRAARLP